MESKSKKYLKGLAHNLEPLVFIGNNKVNKTVIKAIEENLDAYELIKIKFIKHKESKKELLSIILEQSNANLISLIGNIAILYRQHKDITKQKIKIK
jgi:RNA-binding protein